MVFDPIDSSQVYCKRCSIAADEEFQKIRDLIEKHGEMSPMDIKSFTNLPMDTIMSFVNDHRLGTERKPLEKVFHVSDEDAIRKKGNGFHTR